jgi:DNA repair exonuclease SbcCD ATPase subunit
MTRLATTPVDATSQPRTSATVGTQRLRSIHITGGFLDGLSLDLADGLNCIIGARGTGKTTVLELVRYALDCLPDANTDPAGRKRVEALVDKNLEGGRIELTVETKDGLTYIVSRAAGEEPLVLTEDRQPTDINLAAGGLFKADIYSQNEVESIADRTVSQLDLIDNFEAERIADIQARIQQAEANLAHNAAAIIPLQDKLATLADELNQLGSVEAKLKAFATVGGADAQAINEAHAHKALRDRERRAMEAIDQFLREFREQLNNLDGALIGQVNSLFTRDILTGPNSAALTAIRQALIDRGYEIDDLLEQARERIKAQQSAHADASEALSLAHAHAVRPGATTSAGTTMPMRRRSAS